MLIYIIGCWKNYWKLHGKLTVTIKINEKASINTRPKIN